MSTQSARPEPRPAATVMLLRHGDRHAERGLEVLMVRRNPAARFMPGIWVFPGGAVDAPDGGPAASDSERIHRACAARELAEETGVEVDQEALRPWSRWITPEAVPIRFDTRFYVALAPSHARPRPDGSETVDARWLPPQAALEEGRAGELPLSFPTERHLESLAAFANAGEALEAARGRVVEPILPKVVTSPEGHLAVVLPGEPGYD